MIITSVASNRRAISIHALRVEGDNPALTTATRATSFLSTPSGWRATRGWRASVGQCVIFLSTPSGWRATPPRHGRQLRRGISIHALRVEGDPDVLRALKFHFISIHALRVEGDTQKQLRDVERLLFLSTPSGWRATSARDWRRKKKAGNFYPRPPGGGRPLVISDQIAGPPGFLSTPSG